VEYATDWDFVLQYFADYMYCAFYHAVQNLLSSHLLFKNTKIIIDLYKTKILPFVLYGSKIGLLR
jgi:hypothetical protein